MHHRKGKKILLVEDDADDVLLIRQMLSEAKVDRFVLDRVSRLSDAITKVQKSPRPDAVLLDLSLPDGQGLSTFSQLYAAAPSIPIVVLSGRQDESLALQAVQSGAQDYLVKGEVRGEFVTRALSYSIERKRAERRLTYIAEHDGLTGAINRSHFQRHLVEALDRAQAGARQVALMLLDLDNFKYVNDTYGHAAGDHLLRAMVERLAGCVREQDSIARLGGDEFTIFLDNLTNQEQVVLVADRVLAAMREPFVLGCQRVRVTASVGIALYPRDAITPDHLLEAADTAMYSAKHTRGNLYRFYRERSADETEVEVTAVQRSPNREPLVLEYRPEVDVRTGRIVSIEASIRQRTPNVSDWESALREACERVTSLPSSAFPKVRVSLEVPADHIRSPVFLKAALTCIETAGLEPSRVRLDIPRGAFYAVEWGQSSMRTLRERGIKIALAEYDCMSFCPSDLRDLPIDALKLSQASMKNIFVYHTDTVMLDCIIRIARSLGLAVIPTGLGTRDQFLLLREFGCDFAQGDWVGSPSDIKNIERKLHAVHGLPQESTRFS